MRDKEREDSVTIFGHSQWYKDSNGKLQLFLSARSKGELCRRRYCREPRRVQIRYSKRKDKMVVSRDTLCARCILQKWRANHPRRYAFYQVRESARKRSIPFLLTFDEFADLIAGTNYLEEKGRSPDSLHIDRIDGTKPYAKGNCRVIKCSENTGKDNNGGGYVPEDRCPF